MDVRKLLLVCTITQVLTACVISQPKDVEQAKRLIENGRESEGEQILTYLSSQGYYDAKSALAVYFSEQDDIASLKKAEALFSQLQPFDERESRWYLRLLVNLADKDKANISDVHEKLQQAALESPDMLIDLVRFEYKYRDALGLNEQALVDKYIDRVDGGSFDYFRLIDIVENPAPYMADVEKFCEAATDPNALNYCWRLKAKHVMLNNPASLSEFGNALIAAVNSNDVENATAFTIVRQMLSSSYGEPNIGEGYRVAIALNLMNPELWLRIANYEIKDRYIMEADALVEKLTALSEQGYAEADLLLAKFYIYGNRTAKAPWKVEKHLLKSVDLAEAKYRLGILYLSGELGNSESQRGKDLLVAAGRQGYFRAYSELMNVFSGFPGVLENKVYSHTFASICQILGVELRQTQLEYLTESTLTPEEHKASKLLVVEELAELGMSESFVNQQIASMDL